MVVVEAVAGLLRAVAVQAVAVLQVPWPVGFSVPVERRAADALTPIYW